MGDQSILEDLDESADDIEADADPEATEQLGKRLARAQGRVRNSVAMVALACLVADLIDSLPTEIRCHSLLVFMRLVQRMMDAPEDRGSLH